MSLQDIDIKNEYRSLINNVAKDFYVPLLRESILYQRAVGFFSSSALVEISKGLIGLVRNGGKIQIVASPCLTQEDIDAISKGYELREKIIERALLRNLYEAETSYQKSKLNLLSQLIADGILDIKIALLQNQKEIGMYHEKMGIIHDVLGNKIAFAGSMNETATGMMTNYESIDVFCSWTEDYHRVIAKENAFIAIWHGYEPSIQTIEFPNLGQEIIKRYKLSTTIDYDTEIEEMEANIVMEDKIGYISRKPKKLGAVIPTSVSLHDYQLSAIDNWASHEYRGIFDMATGTGKTFTGLGALARLCDTVQSKLGVIIVCPFQHLVEQWVQDIKLFGMSPIIGYSRSPQKDWKKLLENAIRDQRLKVAGKHFFCFICTNATFSSKTVQTILSKAKGELLLMVDEAHNFGATNLSKLLSERFTYRLALSATLERHNDEEGTDKLLSFFENKCIEYTLDRAIAEKKLTPYKYYPVVVSLTDDELRRYEQLSFEMAHNLIKGKDGKLKLSKYGEILALKRARIVAGATEKINMLREKILPYRQESFLLVYCGATKILSDDLDFTDVDDEDMRQIDVITQLLGNELNMKVSQFTSKEDVQERAILKREFEKGENLQALIAIKCLDEGVNIPKIKTAFILASTTNPKEYIQRRGRVLRLASGKEYAEIYDFVTLPRPLNDVTSLTAEQAKRDLSLVRNEINRMEEFSRIAMNPMQARNIIGQIKEIYHLYERETDFVFEG
ncbi:MAG: DEAD/DEAH box helicase family protein [Peptococcaceae bacterium]